MSIASNALFSAFRFREVTSTMDVAKEICKLIGREQSSSQQTADDGSCPSALGLSLVASPSEGVVTEKILAQIREEKRPFVVFADLQTKGRGTGGRSWAAPNGNLAMTLGIHTGSFPMAVLPALPLLVGLSARAAVLSYVAKIAGEQSREYAELRNDLGLKWPNDLLFCGKKLMGVLIENEGDYMLVGVGINVGTAPVVDTSDGSREATCLREGLDGSVSSKIWRSSKKAAAAAVADNCTKNESTDTMVGMVGDGSDWSDVAVSIGELACAEILGRIKEAAARPKPAEARLEIVRDFDALMTKDIVYRKRVEGGGRGPEVMPLGLNEWGGLRVKHVGSLKEEVLSADYLN